MATTEKLLDVQPNIYMWSTPRVCNYDF